MLIDLHLQCRHCQTVHRVAEITNKLPAVETCLDEMFWHYLSCSPTQDKQKNWYYASQIQNLTWKVIHEYAEDLKHFRETEMFWRKNTFININWL